MDDAASSSAVQAGGLNPASVPAVLRAAADLIEPEGRWAQKAYARGEDGESVAWGSESATCFCARGAIRRAANPATPYLTRPVWEIEEFVAEAIGVGRSDDYLIARWNDAPERTQAEVVSALRRAADLAEADGPLSGHERNEAKPNGLNDLKAKGPQS